MSNKQSIYIWSSDPGTKKSTSAGAFYLIAREFLDRNKENAIVYGCAFDENVVARHIRITNERDLIKLQGSKYVQSKTEDVYKLIEKDLKDGKKVLFSGTACQTLAVKNYIGSAFEHLYTIDVLCHGVPSPMFWRKYVEHLSNGVGTITDVRFRNKSKTNRMGYLLKYNLAGKEKTVYPNESVYYQAFIDSTSLRPSCYRCPFVGDYEGSNLTIGDSNIKSFHPTEAVSLLIIRDEKGFRLFNLIIDNVESINADLDSESMINKKLVEPAQYTAQREHFYMDEHYVQMANYSLRNRLVNRIKNMIPTFVKDSIKYR